MSHSRMVSGHQIEAEIAAAIRSLSRWPGLQRIWIFGSAARGEAHLDWRSDLDFAVEGLPDDVYCRAWAELDEAVGLPVDLVRWETVDAAFRDEITKWGRVIYEA